ncbi:hypothetical protein Taro_022774, partial [Colocasia esculenta]|nr:hypothetical protein [Colocasia esculenta]
SLFSGVPQSQSERRGPIPSGASSSSLSFSALPPVPSPPPLEQVLVFCMGFSSSVKLIICSYELLMDGKLGVHLWVI